MLLFRRALLAYPSCAISTISLRIVRCSGHQQPPSASHFGGSLTLLPKNVFAAPFSARAMPRRARNDASDDDEHDGAGVGAGSSSSAAAAPVVKGSLLPRLMRSVIKVFATHAKPNFSLPWQMKQPVKSTSSGFVIAAPGGGKLIVTNAHSVSYATTLQVRLQGTSDKVLARILTVAHDCDLALLTVDEPGFWKAAPALELGSLPYLHDEVIVVGYPLGGEQISITAGVVSRIDHSTYAASNKDHLVVQVDSAINGGNSGGPVFDTATGKVVGVAFQALENSENIGYIVPVPVLEHLLEDFRRTGAARGFGRVGFLYQSLENKSLKAFLGLPPSSGGILISRVSPVSPLAGKVRERDVLLALDGQAIADDGTVAFPGRADERINFGVVLTNKHIGDAVTLSLHRDGKPLSVTVPVADVPDLVPHSLNDRKPSYLVHAGLVFTVLSEPYLAAQFGKEWDARAPVRLVHASYHGLLERPGQQVVILTSILSNSVVVGYDEAELASLPLEAVNGVRVNNLLHAARLIRDCAEPTLRLEFADNKLIALPTAQAVAATAETLKTHAIPAALSDDLVQALAAEQDGGSSSAGAAAGAGAGVAGAASAAAAPASGGGRKRKATANDEEAAAASASSSSAAAPAAVSAAGVSKRKVKS